MKSNLIVDKSKAFALRIIRMYQFLTAEKHETILSKQVLRSGTSIGANVREAIRGQSSADFYSRLNISLKEASETEYWLELLYESGYISKEAFSSIYSDCQELISILVAIIPNSPAAARLYKIKIRPRSGHRNSEFRIKNGVYKLKTLSKVYMGLVLMFLYVPIFVLIVFSFNETKSRSVFSGFTLDWYAKLFRNEVIISSLMNTIIIAVIASIAATLLGTLAAIGINSMRKVPKAIVMNITNMPIVNPEIVTGVSLMLLFVFFAARMNLEFGFVTLVIAHITFDVPYVILNVMPKFRQMDPNLFEAAQDLGCSPFTALRKVILPEIMPGVVSGFLMSFTFSLDDFVISYFTSGSTSQTLPITIYSMTRRKISPEINALSTLIFVVVVIVLVVKHIIETKQEQRNRANGGDEE